MKNMYLTHWGGCASHMFEYTLNWPTHVGQCIDNPECICDKSFINTFIIFRTHWPDIPIIDYSYTPSKARDKSDWDGIKRFFDMESHLGYPFNQLDEEQWGVKYCEDI